jgi:hypothetical protein
MGGERKMKIKSMRKIERARTSGIIPFRLAVPQPIVSTEAGYRERISLKESYVPRQ